jgi:hypothetical protein
VTIAKSSLWILSAVGDGPASPNMERTSAEILGQFLYAVRKIGKIAKVPLQPRMWLRKMDGSKRKW